MNNKSNNDVAFLVSAYDKMDLNDKRNEYNSLLFKTNELVNQVLIMNGMSGMFQVRNYDSNKDVNLSEEEFLTFLYEDLYKLKTNMVLLLALNASNNKNE